MKYLNWGLVLSVVGCVYAADVPKALMYHGKPIDAMCFLNMGGSKGYIKLSNCGLAKEAYKREGKNDELYSKGFNGYDWKDAAQDYTMHGYSYYKYFQASEGYYLIHTINSTGGSGSFSDIMLVKRVDQDTLKIEGIIGGDRCNGGVSGVKRLASGVLEVKIQATPYDVFSQANDNPHKLKAYDDLASCAVCFGGNMVYQLDASKAPAFQYIELPKVKEISELTEQGRYQQCFNQLYFNYLKSGQKRMSLSELKVFVRQFNQTCVK